MAESNAEFMVFVSYSRADVSFARFARKSLAEHGVSCWIDVDKLGPGDDWAERIETTLNKCRAVLLIASTESLASVYCRNEWRRAISAGTPIVLAIIEVVAVPDELLRFPIIDMRIWAGIPWGQLAVGLQSGVCESKAAPDRWRVPKPLAVASLALVILLVVQLVLLSEWFLHARNVLKGTPGLERAVVFAHLAILVAWIGWTTYWSWRFAHRDATFNGLMAMVIGVPFLWVVHGIFTSSWLAFYSAFIGGFAMYGVVYLSLDSGNWLPTRRQRRHRRPQQFYWLHSDATADRASPPQPALSGAVHFRVYNARSDEHVAKRLVTRLELAGLHAASTGETEDVRLTLLSNATPIHFKPLTDRHPTDVPTVCVVLSAIAVDDERALIQRYQWFDFRSREDSQIDRLAQWLRERVPTGLAETNPLQYTDLPVGPYTLRWFLVVMASLLMLEFVLRFLETPFMYQAPQPLWVELSGVGSALAAATAAATLRGRLVTFRLYITLFVVAVALLLIHSSFEAADTTFFVVTSIMATLCGFGSASSIRDWLPAAPFRWSGGETLAPEPPWRYVTRQALRPLVAAIVAAIMIASSDVVRGF